MDGQHKQKEKDLMIELFRDTTVTGKTCSIDYRKCSRKELAVIVSRMIDALDGRVTDEDKEYIVDYGFGVDDVTVNKERNS